MIPLQYEYVITTCLGQVEGDTATDNSSAYNNYFWNNSTSNVILAEFLMLSTININIQCFLRKGEV